MEVYFSIYELRPKHKANRLSDLTPKRGIFLKSGNRKFSPVDYFPHENLGDQSVEDFLESFPNQSNPYHLSVINQLRAQEEPLPKIRFYNHQLWRQGDEIQSPVVKYKIMHKGEKIPAEILRSDCKIRLDANGIFTEREFFKYLSMMNIQEIARIEYIEDPCQSCSWQNIPIPTARDFIQGDSYQVVIHKPNRQDHVEPAQKIIFSGYMGSQLGSIHAYRQLVSKSNLNLYHGILTPNSYEDEPILFSGSYETGFVPDLKQIQSYMSLIQDRQWSYLCSI